MKTIAVLLLLALAGCASVPPLRPEPQPLPYPMLGATDGIGFPVPIRRNK